MDEKEERIIQMGNQIVQAIKNVFDEESPCYIGKIMNQIEFMVALNYAITDIYNILGVQGGNLDLLEANYMSNKALVLHLMEYGKLKE